MNKKAVYAGACVLAGTLLVSAGAFLVIPSTSYPIPDLAESQIYRPVIEVFAGSINQPIMVAADFKNSKGYVLRFAPVDIHAFLAGLDKPEVEQPEEYWVEIESQLKDFQWTILDGLSEIEVVDRSGPAPTSKPTGRASGSSRWLGLHGTFTKDKPYAEVAFVPGSSEYIRQGPYVRICLPMIDISTPAIEPMTNNKLGPSDLVVSVLDGKNLYPPKLGIRVVTSPWDTLNSELIPQRINPEPETTPPLTWVEDTRFMPDLLYRDSSWDRRASVKIFLGGIAVGLGVGIAILPIDLLKEVRFSSTPTSSASRRRRRRK